MYEIMETHDLWDTHQGAIELLTEGGMEEGERIERNAFIGLNFCPSFFGTRDSFLET